MNSPQDSSHPQAPESQQVSLVAQARVPTEHGTFTMKLFKEQPSGLEHVALVMGEMGGTTLVRVHSECMTGDVFGSLRCDCGPQLHFALDEIGKQGSGVVLYLRQEGRGIGLINKLKAYALQDEGLDTVEANLRLGFPADLRNFEVAAQMLSQLGVDAVRLMTNNPRKVATLEKHGVKVVERVPVRSLSQSENHHYLATKALKLGHHMDWLPEYIPPKSDDEAPPSSKLG
ncbi:GTP cyclohydrolase II [Aquabacterium sp. CECT 9606]|uniref:GTP cyclohydrolase II n=1 Tax=Aquabacterium sp. CECT 9606 TaxID=2845822 RepID=UPI001E3A0844|nr:GTP cyclohydrolase II [Aquabacterium sp. CECT 9606]CAH0355805.1 GTP cyclohydrolase-2 [Aquabacterium sp. CECT 9606]